MYGDMAGNIIIKREPGLSRLGLYIHIPFCVKKCGYCDFLSAPADEDTIRIYFDALLAEIGSYDGRTEGYYVPTIYIGGGTPSAVSPDYICEVMKAVRRVFRTGINITDDSYDAGDVEITIEANPGTVNGEKLALYKEAGINRISFGLQSVHDHELKLLGRIHTYKQFEENYRLARSLGYGNINIDLISALPGQTINSWEETLRITAGLSPEHISAYSLIIEEGTPFYDIYKGNASEISYGYPDLPDEDTDRAIYAITKDILNEYGYHQYEISNYSRPGYICRHNASYWTGIQYLGMGLGASSLIENTRFNNTASLSEYIGACKEYCKNVKNAPSGQNYHSLPGTDKGMPDINCLLPDLTGIRRNVEHLQVKQQMEEFMFLGLRMTKGISRDAFLKRFNIHADEIYGEVLRKLESGGLILNDGDNIRLTGYGTDISNYVLAEFMLN
jgi:oxygen-independent coproporphyrinogen-3 oxidase